MAPIQFGCAMRLLLTSLFLLSGPVDAQIVKMLVQSSPLAGFQYHAGSAVWSEMKVGDPLTLIREPLNPHDGNAVRIEWHGQLLGYLPRAENRSVAAEMDRGAKVSGRIGELHEARDPWQRLRVDVFVTL